MSDLEANKNVAKKYFDALTDGDVKALDALMADDFEYWVLGDLPGLSGTHRKEALLSMVEPFTQMWDGPLVFTVTGVTAEGDTVALEVQNEGRTKTGKCYHNFYHIAFELADGKITRVREYFDTVHARETIIQAA